MLLRNPTVVKVDVEGAEYELFDALQPGDLTGVRGLFVEFHPADDKLAKIAKIQRYAASEGLTALSNRLRAFVAVRQKEEDWLK